MSEVKITVLMPCYNAADHIAEAIRSVLAQSFRDFELLVVNDGSTDGSTSIIRSFKDERIVLIDQEQQGIAAALNNGLRHARAEYIARFDADDLCCPSRLEKQYGFIVAHPEYSIIGSGADYVDAAGEYIFTHIPAAKTDDAIRRLPYHTCPFIHTSVLYKKELVKKIGYNIHAHSFEDHLLWKQLRPYGKMYNMTEGLVTVRLNPRSITMDERKRPTRFHQIKNKALRSGTISSEEGNALLLLIREQNNSKNKTGAYYSLLAKKYLWNNHMPGKSRAYIKRAMALNSFDIRDHLLWAASFLPKRIIHILYTLFLSLR